MAFLFGVLFGVNLAVLCALALGPIAKKRKAPPPKEIDPEEREKRGAFQRDINNLLNYDPYERKRHG